MSWKLESHWNEERIRRAIVCSMGLLALLLAGVAFPTDTKACHDYGDASDSYGTLRANDGARHAIVSGFHLGGSIDEDGDGQPTSDADGDDLDGLDDEDGILLPSVLARNIPAQVDAILTTDGGLSAYLNAWIDYNHDGKFDGLGEQVITDHPLTGGSNLLSITVPLNAELGETYARFRLNSGGGLMYKGPASDGEVEDYLVTIVPVPEPATLSLVALGLVASAGFRRLRN